MAETPFSSDSAAPGGGLEGQGEGERDPVAASPAADAVTAGESDASTASAPEIPAALPTPEPVPTPEPPVALEPAAVTPAVVPAEAPGQAAPDAELPAGVAATIAVPPLEADASREGGEWEMLVERLNAWWSSGEIGRQWQRIRGPLKGVAILVVVLLTLRVYATVVSTIDAIPLVSGLLELTGLIAVLQFSATRLLRSSDRQRVLTDWRRRWQEFRGQD